MKKNPKLTSVAIKETLNTKSWIQKVGFETCSLGAVKSKLKHDPVRESGKGH